MELDIVWYGLPAVAIIMAATQAAKQAGLPSRFAGLFALILGAVGGALSAAFADTEVVASAVQGVAAALATSGLWSTTKAAGQPDPRNDYHEHDGSEVTP